MPIEFTPSRRLIDAYLRLRKRLRGENPEAAQIKTEAIEAVNEDGTYVVKGAIIPASGNVKLSSGQRVDVVYKNARPRVIIGHNARRAHFNVDLPGVAFPVVEELFLPDTGNDRRLWFRNGTDFKPILFDPSFNSVNMIGGSLIEVTSAFWGRSSANHFAITGVRLSDTHRMIAVYSLNRPKANEPFSQGFNIKPTLVRLYDLDDPAGPSFGTISVSSGTAFNANPMRAFSSAGVGFTPTSIPGASVSSSAVVQSVYAGIAQNGDLLLSMNVQGSAVITGAQVGQSSLFSYTVGQLLVNFTRGTVLASHAPDLVVPLSIIVVVSDPPLVVACASAGSAVTSTGHNSDSGIRGDVTLIGARMDNNVPVLNSYALVEHADLTVSSTTLGGMTAADCYPGGSGSIFSAAVFRIVGEFAQVIATLPAGTILTAQRVHFQASRTHVFWAKIANLTYLPLPILNLIDLRKSINLEIGTQPVLVLLSPTQSIPQLPLRQMVAVRSGLLFAPQGPSDKVPPDPPFNVQFFVAGDVIPPNLINQADLKKNDGLQKLANFKQIKLPAEVEIVQAEDADLQTLNSTGLRGNRTGSSL